MFRNAIFGLIISLTVLGSGHAATIYVPDDFPTIQDAIDAAVTGNTIIVRPGTYVENIDFIGKAITVTSEHGPRVTTIDGNQAGSVVLFQSGEGMDSALDGFTVTNSDFNNFGGIYCDSSSPTITKNIITGNGARYGGGIHCSSSSPAIANNTILGNWADNGGGIYCTSSSPNIANNIILENRANYRGGGICCDNGSCPSITSNTISENSAYYWYEDGFGSGIFCGNSSDSIISGNIISANYCDYVGGGIGCIDSSPAITSNIISGNIADCGGSGMALNYSSSVITNNTISANSWDGIDCSYSSPVITNNTISGNNGFGICCSSSTTITNTICWNNSYGEISGATPVVTYCDIEGGWPGTGNIDADPLFVKQGYWDDNGTPYHPYDDFWIEGDFHLTWDSPCRDIGDNSSIIDAYDFEGDPRIAPGIVDMGADEFYFHLYHTGDFMTGLTVDVTVVGIPTKPVFLGLGSGIQDPPLSTRYGDLYLELPLAGHVHLGDIPGNGILTFQASVPTSWNPGEEYPFQALVGTLGSPNSVLTNLMVLEALPGVVHVPDDKPTIQEAIEYVTEGGVVIVKPGIYVENIDFLGKAIIVKSAQGAAVTVIDGNQEGSVVSFKAGETGHSVLDGFTITNGNAGSGGGISCWDSSPTITNNIITGNTATWGSGICCDSGSCPAITSNIISGNTADIGGGIQCWYCSYPSITNNTITGNTAQYGGGIHCEYHSSATIMNTILWCNSAPNGPEICIRSISDPSTVTISYSDVEGGLYSCYVASGCTLNWGSGMIDADPLFVSGPQGDFYLSQIAAGQGTDSPCVDAGDPASTMIDGTTRTDEEQDSGVLDMGYHYRTND